MPSSTAAIASHHEGSRGLATKPEGYGEFKRGWPIVLSALLGIGLGLSPVPFYTLGSFAPQLASDFHWVSARSWAACRSAP